MVRNIWITCRINYQFWKGGKIIFFEPSQVRDHLQNSIQFKPRSPVFPCFSRGRFVSFDPYMSEGTYAYGFGGAFAALGRGEIVGVGGAIFFGKWTVFDRGLLQTILLLAKNSSILSFFGKQFDLETILVWRTSAKLRFTRLRLRSLPRRPHSEINSCVFRGGLLGGENMLWNCGVLSRSWTFGIKSPSEQKKLGFMGLFFFFVFWRTFCFTYLLSFRFANFFENSHRLRRGGPRRWQWSHGGRCQSALSERWFPPGLGSMRRLQGKQFILYLYIFVDCQTGNNKISVNFES